MKIQNRSRICMIISAVIMVIALVLRTKMRDAFTRSRKAVAEINASLESSISGIRVTKAFTNADKEAEKFEEGNNIYIDK